MKNVGIAAQAEGTKVHTTTTIKCPYGAITLNFMFIFRHVKKIEPIQRRGILSEIRQSTKRHVSEELSLNSAWRTYALSSPSLLVLFI